ncbi:SAM-dependent methyltransferase [Streptomyces sp. t39]|uniref:SAM-dependent methyltransferase n=1 Tax=Streptomyces sp. t39 TaxID=1828156 RepID=UPI0011CDC9B4|nr:class I SAM-dependent methyltransferase [Streptomyces sp. t39]TXS48124.1 class I SAM-dependent methyltransferase [Streptomyces sp. t39]
MDREEISRLAHTDHPIAAPVGDDAVRRILAHAVPPGDGARVLDLGCGGGEWLLRALAAYPGLRATGVDVSAGALAHARRSADERGVGERLTLHHGDAARFAAPHTYDLVICVGATHAFGGLPATLAAARRHLAPGGRVLVGESHWAGDPSPEAVEMLGELAGLAETVDLVTADGWAPVHGHISTRQELDAYEWAWTGALTSWALDHAQEPDAAQALAVAAGHRDGWLRVYRDAWGFVCLVLRPSPA